LVLAGIVAAYHLKLHVNQTTVALTLLLYILFLAAQWGLRYAVVMSVAATFLYNYYFLPPIGTLVINDPQNWLALFAFLVTAVVGARLSERARDEADDARLRQREIEILYSLSRELLQTENVAGLLNAVAPAVMLVTHADAVVLYLLDGDRRYLAGDPDAVTMDEIGMRQHALTLPGADTVTDTVTAAHFGSLESRIPIRVGVRPRGLLIIKGVSLSTDSLEAIGGLVSITLDRARALDDVTRAEASKESERLRSLMIDSITHELRTPLTAIKASATTLLLHDPTSADKPAPPLAAAVQHELVTIIDEEADRLNRLVSEAVEMAQLDAQEVHMTFVPTDLVTIVDAAVRSCASALVAHDLRQNIPTLPPVMADSDYIEKVLINLLENAAKYSAPGTPIFISAERRSGTVILSVADHGQGIDISEQELIFERFYRANAASRQTSGTGMGLAISRAILEAHQGTLTVTSQLGEGSVFSFSLPIASQSLV
jgi:two-component system sensor histidine kinase KdpD